MKTLLTILLVIAFLFTGCCSKNNTEDKGENAAAKTAAEESTSTGSVETEENLGTGKGTKTEEGTETEGNAKTGEGTKVEENNGEPSQEGAGEPTGIIEVHQDALTVEITYPASFVESFKDEILNIKEQGTEGVEEIRENEDGSITVKMTRSKYNELMEEARTYLTGFLDGIASSGNYPSIKKVTYNGDFSEIVLEVDKEAYQSSFDGIAAINIGVAVGFYKMFTTGADYKINMKFKDINTGEIFEETVFPDDIENL